MKGNGGGEIVQVQGGHIIRATGRKDRHSKVYTAKGPRDRRVRLSAHTAIQFYDVQDRLGYDRPSKAVDWLIKKAKPAIDKLAELPPFDPNNMNDGNLGGGGGSSNMGLDDHNSDSSGYGVQLRSHIDDSPSQNNDQTSSYAVNTMHTQSIDDTIKSFFPTTSVANSINYESYQTDMISRAGSQTQDLCLSLHTFRDRNLIHGQTTTDEGNTTHSHVSTDHQGLFPGSVTMGFDSNSGWRDNQPPDIGQFSRLMAWSTSGSNGGGDGEGGGGAAGLIFNSLPLPSAQQGLFGQSGDSFSQRGTLQSSYSPSSSGRAWDDLPDHHKAQAMHHAGADGFMGFYVPSGIRDGVVSNKDSASLSPHSSH